MMVRRLFLYECRSVFSVTFELMHLLYSKAEKEDEQSSFRKLLVQRERILYVLIRIMDNGMFNDSTT